MYSRAADSSAEENQTAGSPLHLHNFVHMSLLFFGIFPKFLLLIYRSAISIGMAEKMIYSCSSSSDSVCGGIPKISCSICAINSGVKPFAGFFVLALATTSS